MTRFKQAHDAFVKSETYEGLTEPTTIKAPRDQRQYLKNRIERAYAAGWNDANKVDL